MTILAKIFANIEPVLNSFRFLCDLFAKARNRRTEQAIPAIVVLSHERMLDKVFLTHEPIRPWTNRRQPYGASPELIHALVS